MSQHINTTKPLVSVIIPTFKRSDKLSRAIDSILKQTYSNVEVIVVDDNGKGTCNQIETANIINRYLSLGNFKYVVHPVNKNGSAARNTGVKYSTGDFIMFLDDDDEFLPTKIEVQIYKLCSLGDSWGACYTRVIYKKDECILQRSKFERDGDLIVDALGRNLFIAAGSNLMIRKTVFQMVGGFDESFVRNQDLELLTKILSISRIAFVNQFGLIVYIHRYETKNDFELVSMQYYETFKDVINTQNEQNRYVIYTLLNLQVFKYYITSRHFSKAFLLIRHSFVNPFEAFFYMLHMLYRLLFKYSFGYTPKFKRITSFCLANRE